MASFVFLRDPVTTLGTAFNTQVKMVNYHVVETNKLTQCLLEIQVCSLIF